MISTEELVVGLHLDRHVIVVGDLERATTTTIPPSLAGNVRPRRDTRSSLVDGLSYRLQLTRASNPRESQFAIERPDIAEKY